MADTVDFAFYVYENNSTDQTRERLHEFMKGRRGHFMYDDGEPVSEGDMGGTGSRRIARMVRVRNRLLEACRDQWAACDWLLFIDSNVIFDLADFKALLEAPAREDCRDVAVFTVNVKAMFVNSQRAIDNNSVPENASLWTAMHYYDTYAFVDAHDRMHYPSCLFDQCLRDACIKGRDGEGVGAVCEDTTEVFDVRAAWGGFVLIKARTFTNPEVKWRTIDHGGHAMCEHVYLCDAIRTACAGAGRVVVLPKIKPFALLPALE